MPFESLLNALATRPWAWGVDALGLTLLIGYHLYLWWVYRHRPQQKRRGRSDRLRRAWVATMRAGNQDRLAVQTLRETLNRAGGHYNRGTRVFLLAFPFVLWLIGSDWFLGGVLVSLLLLYRFDFQPDAHPAPTTTTSCVRTFPVPPVG
jgi:uncharacterized membrane protein